MPGINATQSNNGRTNYHGIEVMNALTWQGWEPGREYTKNLVLKNVRVKTQKLKYKVPTTRFFSTLYPQPIVLSAGTSFTLPITFRPLEKVCYDDKIEFSTNEGYFVVPIQAVLPKFEMVVPEHINFNMCAAQDFVQLTFEIRNASELVTPFCVECKDPFVIEPNEGIMEPFTTQTLTATFKPKAAVVYEALAVVKYGAGMSHAQVIKLEGIGKYPHLLVSSAGVSKEKRTSEIETVVSFGNVPIGKTVEKWVELHNLSPVNAPFTVDHPKLGASQIDTVFTCMQRHGVVPALSTIRIPISYSPNTIGTQSIDYFHVKAIGNVSKTVITCVGSSKGPKVTLNHAMVNFGQINSGDTATKTVDIINDSDCDATFNFMVDCDESVFKFEHLSGTLPANSKKTIILLFQPEHPINYYRRITCLVHNQNPLFVDLVGTCHTETVKPAPLKTSHVKRYRLHVDRGLSFIPPEQLNEMVKENKLSIDDQGALFTKQGEDDVAPMAPVALDPMDEFFNDGYYSETTHTPPHVSFDTHQMDFGNCTDLRTMEKQNITVTNHTKGKITVVWMGNDSHIFSVSPATMDIPPQSSSCFNVTFKPRAPNMFYGSELECYAYYKSMRDYRLTEDTTHFPPWCLNLTATAQTFQVNHETFLPRFGLDSDKIVFPAVNATESTYRTILLSNNGTTPILYDFQKDPTNVYSLKPSKGLLSPSEYQLFVVKCQPNKVKTYQNKLQLRLNDLDKNTQEITMIGSAEAPEVLLDNQGVMYFKQTCVGTASQRQYAVKNISRIPLRFEWKMGHADKKLLAVEPSCGVIQPNESQYHTWYFTPKSQEKFVMKPSLIVWGQGQSSTSSGGKKKEFTVRALGEGSLGELKAETTYLDFGTVVVGSSASKQVVLYNESDCALHYKLGVEQNISGPYPEEITEHDPIALDLDVQDGILPARSRKIITATVRPSRRVYYQWTITYQLLTPEGSQVNSNNDEAHHICHILATGVFPSMAVTDARCTGSSIGMSKKQLWGLFALDNMNTCLDSDPSAEELMYTTSTRHSHARRPPVYTRAIQDFNFSAAPVGSEACVVQLMFENTGAVPCEWAFLFPVDLQLELDYWAETGDFDEDELHEMKVMDNKLFSVEPKKGQLDPGETMTVTFKYKHSMPGTDRLPVLLKLTRGREILLNFVGVTVDPGRRYIHFPGNKYMLAPVPIGEKNSPCQIYEMYNGGALPVKYEFDLSPLAAIRAENYDHPIFECLNPMGEILPGQTMSIEWRFSPLEAKTYMVDVPIMIHNGDTALVTFTGVGFDKRVMGDTMPITDQTQLSGVPSVQSLPSPGQLCYLSAERASFGNLPLFTRARQVVTITNRSREHAVAFQWHVTSKRDSKYVTVTPPVSRLEPGQSGMCKVTFISTGLPSFYDLDLICEVMNMTEYADYSQKMKAWQDEKQRQKEEFCITEENPDDDLRIASSLSGGSQDGYGSRPPSGKLNPLVNIRTPSPEAELAKYKALPPIKQMSIDRQRKKEYEAAKLNEQYWAKPKAPKPFLLHLGVTSRTHNVGDYQRSFDDDYKNYYIDRCLSEESAGKPMETTREQKPERIECLEAESDVVAGALTSILRGLLDDPSFHDACSKVVHEPTPLFHQLSTREQAEVEEDADATLTPSVAVPVMVDTDSPQLTSTPFATASAELERLKSASSVSSAASSLSSASHSSVCSQKGRKSGSAPRSRTLTPEQAAQSPYQEEEEQDSPRGSTPEQLAGCPTPANFAFHQGQEMKKTPEFGNVVESIIENTVKNIIQEAFSGEFNIAARPRLVALPPRLPSSHK